jgi:hypothetical protein
MRLPRRLIIHSGIPEKFFKILELETCLNDTTQGFLFTSLAFFCEQDLAFYIYDNTTFYLTGHNAIKHTRELLH